MKNFFSRNGKEGKAKPKEDLLDTPAPTATESEDTAPNAYSKYGISSPPKNGEETQGVLLTEAEKRIKKDGFAAYLKAKNGVYRDEATVLAYLYGRNFFCGKENKKERIRRVKNLLGSKKAIANLLKLVKSDGDRDDTATQKPLYVNTKVALERYLQQPGAFSFLCDDESTLQTPILYCRTQARGNCFIHGPCMANSYLLQKRGINLDDENSDLGVVDVQKFIRRTFTDQELYDYLLSDDGGESKSTYETILKATLGKELRPGVRGNAEVLLDANDKSLRKLLSKYGPGLVSEFQVSGHFFDGGDRNPHNEIGYIQFTGGNIEKAKGVFVRLDGKKLEADDDGKQADEKAVEFELQQYLTQRQSDPRKKLKFPAPKNEEESSEDSHGNEPTAKEAAKKKSVAGKHSMVLIGGRRDESENKDYFLLQNWWHDMQLAEVDLDYLDASDALLYFVRPENFVDVDSVDLQQCYSMNRYKVAEAYNLDREDTKNGCFNRTPRERF